jgi:hypothetical protein
VGWGGFGGADGGAPEAPPDTRFLSRLTTIARPVDEQKIMHRQQPRAAEAAKYFDIPGLIGSRTTAASRNPAVPVGFQKRCSCHNSRSRRRRLPAGVPATDHFGRPAYRACVARGVICIVRIVIPRKPPRYRSVQSGPGLRAWFAGVTRNGFADKSHRAC